jgi:hypothetical protein
LKGTLSRYFPRVKFWHRLSQEIPDHDIDEQTDLVFIRKILDNVPQKDPAFYQNLEKELNQSINNILKSNIREEAHQSYADFVENHKQIL